VNRKIPPGLKCRKCCVCGKWSFVIHPLGHTLHVIPNTKYVTIENMGGMSMNVKNVIESLGGPVTFKDIKGFTLERNPVVGSSMEKH
jgi:hypothetical protein